ncbi:MAG: secretin N-terminal domain-containing protein [Planctomycetaceae bacterium]
MASKTRRKAFGLAVGSLLVATAVLLVGNSFSFLGMRGQVPLAAAEPDARPPAVDADDDDGGDGHSVRLNYFNASWATVLRKVAKETGAELVMQKFPAGYVSRFDRTRYTRPQAVRILNRELEPEGFRLLEQGNHLVLIQLDSLNTQYPRPLVPDDGDQPRRQARDAGDAREDRAGHGRAANERFEAEHEPAAFHQPKQLDPAQAADARVATDPRGGPSRPRVTRRVETASARDVFGPDAEEVVVDARRFGAKEVARVIYSGLRDRAELLNAGPGDLPAFRVQRTVKRDDANGNVADRGADAEWSAPRGGRAARAHFEIGIDAERDELVVASADEETSGEIVRMIRAIDASGAVAGRTVRLVSSERELPGMEEKLVPILERLATPNRRREVAQLLPQQPGEQLDPRVDPPPFPRRPEAAPGAPGEDEELRIPGLRGPVRLQQVPGVGWIVIGDAEDVKVVHEILARLNILVAGTLAQPHLRELKHVNSEAMALLLNDVYAELVTLRGGQVQAAIIPVVKPNAILVLANANDLRTIDALIVELDVPVDPQTQFEVYPLKHAPATQVATTLQTMYPDQAPVAGAGLRPLVRVVADGRTNSVIVQAAPRDLADIGLVIRRIDRDSSDAVTRMRIFPLKNAAAAELAPVITEAIQNVLSAAPGAPGAPGAPAEGATSRIIEILVPDGDPRSLVRSGILSDIGITADARANTLIVRAPEQSMLLMAELIRQLDQPTPAVASIKVFSLINADATAMANLLTALFAPAAGQAGAAAPPGIDVGEGEDATSRLIPMRFSVDVRTNSLIAVGGVEALRIVEAVLLRLDETDDRERKEVVVKLRNSPAADVGAAITAFIQQKLQILLSDPSLITQALLDRQVVVVPELVSNSLLISANPKYFDQVMQLVADLDKAPPEVMIQVLIVEVDLQNTDEFGIELGFQDSLLFDRGVLEILDTISTTTTAPNGVQTTTQEIVSSTRTPGFNFNNPSIPLGNNAASSPGTVGSQGLSNFSLGRINGDLGFGGLVLSAQSEAISVLLRALAAQRTVNILSRPQIRTLDNQLASIQVGQQVPVIGSATTNPLTGIAQPQLGTPQQVGIILQVTPRITPDGRIIMETIANKSDFSGQGVPIATDGAGGVIESPIFNLTEARAVVSVPDGQTIVLGGMITKNDNRLERKVPWLGDVPFLGRLFRYDSVTSRRTELLIFLTPRVVHSSADSELIKMVETEKMNFLVEEAEAMHGPLFAIEPAPMHPDFCPPPEFLPHDGSYPRQDGGLLPLPHDGSYVPPMPQSSPVPTTIMPSTPLPHTPGTFQQTPPTPGRSTLEDVPPPAPPAFPPSAPGDGAAARRNDLSGRLSSRSR